VIRIVAAVLVAALISSFLSPDLGFDSASLATFLGFLLALVVVLVSFELPGLLEHRRVSGEMGRLRVLPWALIIAVVFVVVSRLAVLQPGYLWGVVLGVVFLRPAGEADEGREAAAGALWTLTVAVTAWLILGWLRGPTGTDGSFLSSVIETALAAVVVGGLEAVAIGLLPFRFMPGAAVYRWSRLAWALLCGVSMFAFIHILVGPTTGYLSDLTAPAWIAALGIFAAFGVFTVLFWGWFRFRPSLPSETSG
jgi:hypothetical protein